MIGPGNMHYAARVYLFNQAGGAEVEMSRVDVNIPKFNQAVVAVVTAAAFVFQLPWLVAVVFAVLALSAVGGARLAPLSLLYVALIRPRFGRNRAVVTEPAGPPRFAQVLGTVMLGAAGVSFLAGAALIGWTLTLVVTSLASVAVLADLCVGCLLYERMTS